MFPLDRESESQGEDRKKKLMRKREMQGRGQEEREKKERVSHRETTGRSSEQSFFKLPVPSAV